MTGSQQRLDEVIPIIELGDDLQGREYCWSKCTSCTKADGSQTERQGNANSMVHFYGWRPQSQCKPKPMMVHKPGNPPLGQSPHKS